MPYATAFERDIFISYCHTDNENPIGQGWIEVFHQILVLRLKQILGARTPEQEVSVWRDASLQGNEAFAARLEELLGKVALVVSVLTPSYIGSEWCKRELALFSRRAEERGGLLVANKTRVFKVIKTPVERERHPPVLQGQTGYEFYVLDKDTRIPREFTLTPGDTNEYKALVVINELAYHIKDTLDAVNAALAAGAAVPAGAAPSPAPAPPAAAGRSVYLAECSFELDEQRNEIRRNLSAHGIRVLPEGDLPLRNPQQFRAAVDAALAPCALAVHLVGPDRAVVLPGETQDTVALQNELAAARCGSADLARLIWIPSGLQPRVDDPLQREFIERLRTDAQAQRGAEVLTQPVQGLIDRIHDLLRKLDEPRKRPADAPPPLLARPLVYLMAHPSDQALADPLREHLFDSGLDVREPLSDPNASEKEIFELHRMNLVDCDAAIVCWGQAGEFWLRSQLSDTQRAVGWRSGKPLVARAVWLGPPATDAKSRLRVHDCEVIDGRAGFSAALLQPLLDRLWAPPGGGA